MTRNEERDLALDSDLMAYVDGTLDPVRMAEVEARLARDAEAREAVAQWRHFDNVIYHSARAADALPANLQIAALERQLAQKLQKQQWRARLLGPGLRQVAAGAVLFAAGWLAHGAIGPERPLLASAHPDFIEPALAGHYAFMTAAHSHAEFGGDEMQAALDWMSEQMQQKIDSPKLERLGYEVESARLVMVENRPVAVFYYRNPEDERVTVSITPKAESQPDYSLRVAQLRDDRMAYWTSDQLHYVVVARVDPGVITTLAAAVQE